MKIATRILSVMLLLFAFGAGANKASAQFCAVCEITEGCFQCGVGLEGGTSCATLSCFRCRTYGTCPTGANCDQSKLTEQPNLVKSNLMVGDDTVRQIAARSPRLAAILIDLDRDETLREHSQFHWMPIDLTAEDVERLLKPETESAAFFAALGRRAKQLHSTAPLVYDITFKLEQDLSRATITIQLVKGSTTNSGESLLQLTLGDAKEISQGKTQWVIVDWKLE